MKKTSLSVRTCLIFGVILLCVQPMGAQQESATPLSEIFLLDLGIVIEPATGKEVYNRQIKPTSTEVDFRIKKVQSGSVYLAASKDLLAAIERINTRITHLEKALQTELSGLITENSELKDLLVTAKESPLIKPEYPKITDVILSPVLENDFQTQPLPIINTVELSPLSAAITFDQRIFLAGVFAYQQDDFNKALNYFSKLQLEFADSEMHDNILYWTADAYQHEDNYKEALNTLDLIITQTDGSDRLDDALIKKGLLYKKLGEIDLAVLSFKQLINVSPESEYTRLASMEIKRAEFNLQ